MKKCPRCGEYNGTKNVKCTKCNKTLIIKSKWFDKFKSSSVVKEKDTMSRSQKRKAMYSDRKEYVKPVYKREPLSIKRKLFYLGLLIGLVVFVVFIPNMYAEMKKSDAEKRIDQTLSKDEKQGLKIYIDRAEDFLEENEYFESYSNVQKALKINQESTAAKEIEQKLIPYMDKPQQEKDGELIKSAKEMAKKYYFEKAIQELEKVKPKLKYSQEDNPKYRLARNQINHILFDKGEYLESVGKTSEAIVVYNRMDQNYSDFMDGQYKIMDIEEARKKPSEVKDDSPGFFSTLFSSFQKTDEEKAADAAEKKAKEAQKQADEAAAFQAKINSAKSVDYDELERAPGRFKDTPVYIEGAVYDIQELNGKTVISMTAYDSYGEKHSVVALYHDKTNIQEGDYIYIYADVLGGYAEYRNKIADYLDSSYYIYYESGSTFYQAPVVEIFYMDANGVKYK